MVAHEIFIYYFNSHTFLLFIFLVKSLLYKRNKFANLLSVKLKRVRSRKNKKGKLPVKSAVGKI